MPAEIAAIRAATGIPHTCSRQSVSTRITKSDTADAVPEILLPSRRAVAQAELLQAEKAVSHGVIAHMLLLPVCRIDFSPYPVIPEVVYILYQFDRFVNRINIRNLNRISHLF